MHRRLFTAVLIVTGSLAYAEGAPLQGNQGYIIGSAPKVQETPLPEEQPRVQREMPTPDIDLAKGVMKADQWVKDHLW